MNSVHLFGFVHKNIRPETILLFPDDGSIGSAFLVGFDSFRMASGKTLRRGEASWKRDLYQHPDRMGITPTEDYVMQHDIYSLGVCLLEIGLWETFVSYEDNNQRSMLSGLHSFQLQEKLLYMARTELRGRMGTKYSGIVVTCLTCMDPRNIDFGEKSDFEDEDGIEVGVRYIEKV